MSESQENQDQFSRACHSLREGGIPETLEFLRTSNPSLSHFLHLFLEDEAKVFEFYTELITGFHRKVSSLDKPIKNARLALLRGAIALMRKRGINLDLLQRVNDMLYEDVLIPPLSSNLLDPDSVPEIQAVKRLRNSQWNTPTKLILDLIFLEHFTTAMTAKLLQISENVLDAYLFSLIHRLVGDVELPDGDQNELELLQKAMTGNTRNSEDEFSKRVAVLKSLLGLDTRYRLSAQDLDEVCQKIHPEYQPESQEESSPQSDSSLIDQIRKENERRKAAESFDRAEGSEFSEYDLVSPTQVNKPNENAIFYAKLAVPVLSIFLIYTLVKTIRPPESPATATSSSSEKVMSMEEYQKLANASIGTYESDEDSGDLRANQYLASQNYYIQLNLNSGVSLSISPHSQFRVISASEFQLIKGHVETQMNKKPVRILCPHGSIQSSGDLIHLSSWHRDFSVAGTFKGSMTATDPRGKQIQVPEGQEVRLGESASLKLSSYNSGSFQKPSRSTYRLRSTQYNKHRMNYKDQLEDEEIKNLLPDEEKLKKAPDKLVKDFLQKL